VRSATGRLTELRAAALIGVAALTLLAGCGGGDDGADAATAPGQTVEPGEVVDIAGTEPVGEMTAGSVAALVECRDWNAAEGDERIATIADVRSQINLEDSGIDAPELTDEEAAELFDNSCKPSWAAGFRLYKLYARGVGFVGLKRMIEESR
jgi:hypothetical protein